MMEEDVDNIIRDHEIVKGYLEPLLKGNICQRICARKFIEYVKSISALKSFIENRSKSRSSDRFTHHEKVKNEYEILVFAFEWKISPQGYEYWFVNNGIWKSRVQIYSYGLKEKND